MLEFDKDTIYLTLAKSPQISSVVFATTCAKRLINSLRPEGSYHRERELADVSYQALTEYLRQGTLPDTDLLDDIDDLIPDEDDEPSFTASVMDDALASLVFAIQSSASSHTANAFYAASRAFDTAFRYSSQALNESIISDAGLDVVFRNPVVQQELSRQQRDLSDAAACTTYGADPLGKILERAMTEAVLP